MAFIAPALVPLTPSNSQRPSSSRGVEHAPGKSTVGAAALQGEINPDGRSSFGWHLAVDL
jgi:hypothetical protein